MHVFWKQTDIEAEAVKKLELAESAFEQHNG